MKVGRRMIKCLQILLLPFVLSEIFICVAEFGAVIDVRVNRRGPSRDVPVFLLLLDSFALKIKILCCN